VSSANPEPPTSKCSISGFENYAPYRDNCYWFSNEAKSWHDAEADCSSQGAHLMSILDDSEQAFVFAHMNAEKIWVGLSDVKPGVNAVFWSDGNQMIISNWAAADFDRGNSYCAYMNGTDGKWYLEACQDSKQFVCKISTAKPPNTNSKGYCISGYEDVIPESDYCYKISTHRHGRYDDASELWSEAEMDCREHGAQLASFHSKVETMSLWQHWNPKTANGLWIGLVAYRDGLGLGPYWRWSDLTDHKDYANWDRGYPQNLYTSTAQCAILTKDGYWRNLDCTISDGTSPSQHVCKAKKVKYHNSFIPDESKGLGSGSKAAIGICALLGVALVAVGGGLVFAKRTNQSLSSLLRLKKSPTLPVRTTSGVDTGFDNVAYDSQQVH